MENIDKIQPLRTVVFADSILAQPVFETLLHGGWIAGLCTSRRKYMAANVQHLAKLAGVSVFEADRADLTVNVGNWLRELQPDVLLTTSFPYRLPPEILRVPRLGAFNIHGGKLPEYRGPQPVFWEILNRETEGAVTLHRMDEEFDHGAVIAAQTIPISPADTYGLHSVRLAFAAIKLVEILFAALIQYGNDIPDLPQDENRAMFYNRPAAKDLIIKWEEQSGKQIRALVKACNPWNQGAFTAIRGINLRLTDVTFIADGGNIKPPGTILTADATREVTVNCLDGSALQLDVISMDEGILPGRVLATYGFQAGERFATLPQ